MRIPNIDLSNGKTIKRLIILFFVILILIVADLVYKSSKFHIVSTYPRTDQISIISTELDVYFNRDLSQNGFTYATSVPFVQKATVKGKMIAFQLSNPLDDTINYTLTIKSIQSTSGTMLKNQNISFRPIYRTSGTLAPGQEQQVVQGQTYHPQTKDNVGFVGFDNLLTYGLTALQENELEQAFFNFNNKEQTVTIDSASIKTEPHDPNKTSDAIDFNVSVDQTNYRAKVVYSNLNTVQLLLYSTSNGAQVFDSGNLVG